MPAYTPPDPLADPYAVPRNASPYLRSIKDGRIFTYSVVLAQRSDMRPWWRPPEPVTVAEPEPVVPQYAPEPEGLDEDTFVREMRLAQLNAAPTDEEIFARFDGTSSAPGADPAVVTQFAPEPEDAPTDAEFRAALTDPPVRPVAVEQPPVLSRTATPVEGTPAAAAARRRGRATRPRLAGDRAPADIEARVAGARTAFDE